MAVKGNAKELAQRAALEGDVASAITQLEALLAGGDAGASASLAEIAAFQGRWQDVLRNAYTYLHKPMSVYATINVLDDMTNLLAVAGLEQHAAWSDIHAEVERIRAHLVAAGDLKPDPDNGANRLAAKIDALLALASSEGKAEFVWDWGNYSKLDEDARTAKFDAAVAELSSRKRKLWKTDAERRRHLFSLANTYAAHRSAVRLYDEEGIADLNNYGAIAFLASALTSAGRADEAWQVVEKTVSLWWPVDFAQMTPVVLLTDPDLRKLMTPERVRRGDDVRGGDRPGRYGAGAAILCV